MLMVMLVLTLAIFEKDERTAIYRTLKVSDGLSSNTVEVTERRCVPRCFSKEYE